MQDLINRLSEQPAFAALLVALLGATLFFLFRRFMTLAALCVVGFLAVGGYFTLTGKEPPAALEDIQEKAREGAVKVGEKAAEVGERIKEKVPEDLKEAAKSGVKDALDE